MPVFVVCRLICNEEAKRVHMRFVCMRVPEESGKVADGKAEETKG